MAEPLTAVIFDFNGVLLWDSEQHAQAWDTMAVKLRGEAFLEEEVHQHILGVVNRDIFAYVLGRQPSDEETATLIEEKESMYRDVQLKRGADFALSPGAPVLLDALKARGVPFTIATSSEITNVRFFFEHLGLDRWFSLDRVVYDDGKRPGKPAPDIYLEAAAKLGVPPQQCVVVEDAPSGIAAAHAAGVGRIIALGTPDRHASLAALPGVDAVITSLKEIDVEKLFSNSRELE